MTTRLLATALAGASLLGACASSRATEEPAWFANQEASLPDSFPSLRDVPDQGRANTDAAYWAQIQAELTAAGAEVRSSPRAQPVTAADDPNLFLEEARRDLERARLAHESN